MIKVEYDLNTTGGLMDQIQALIAPPKSEEVKEEQPKPEHPYFRKPGKGHNHDNCDACGEGGDLICCDKCPSSFHLICHDPPLERTDIPQGDWLCQSCKSAANKNKPSTSKIAITIPKTRSKRTLSTPEMTVVKTHKKTKSKPFEILLRAAKALNPKQFELPRSMSLPTHFPGTDKVERLYINATRRNIKFVRKQTVVAHEPGTLIPNAKCCECGRSCLTALLVVCDYCPLMFHLDCLDPPLSTPPSGRWMCPHHIEHFLDSNLLTSISATERVRLWDKFTGPIDQEAIKLQFFRKVHRENPPFRIKVKLSQRNRVTVPPMVKYHYQNPVKLLPSLRDVLRYNIITNNPFKHVDSNISSNNAKIDIEVKEENTDIKSEFYDKPNGIFESGKFIEHVLSIYNTAKETGNDVTIKTETNNEDLSIQTCDKDSNTEILETHSKCKKYKRNNIKTYSRKFNVNMTPNQTEENSVPNGLLVNESEKNLHVQNGIYCKNYIKNENQPYLTSSSYINDEVDQQLNQLDERLLKLLAYQRVQELLAQLEPSNSCLPPLFSNSVQSKFFNMSVSNELLTQEDIERISRIFSPSKKQTIKPKGRCRARAILCPVVSKHFYNIRSTEVELSGMRHDGIFMGYRPTVSVRFPEAVLMEYRILTIGRGAANDMQLEFFGNCKYISPKHAVIFYDEGSHHFELLNYSCYGTYINNILYSNDETIKFVKKPGKKKPCLQSQVRAIIDKKRKEGIKKIKNKEILVTNHSECMECTCAPNNLEGITPGWEGSAIVNHGSLLRFGCICFVFSIVERAAV